MTMLAEVVDAVIGIDTHRDSHEVETADAGGRPLTTMRIGNDSAGFARLLAAIAELVPGPRVVASVEGSRSYGVGLARALTAAGERVVECEQPSRSRRRGKGKSDAIDAHLAVMVALRLEENRLTTPRADGDREALRILLVAREEMTVMRTAQTNRLRALLLAGDDAGRQARPRRFDPEDAGRLGRARTADWHQSRSSSAPSRDPSSGARAEPGRTRAEGKPRPTAGHRQ